MFSSFLYLKVKYAQDAVRDGSGGGAGGNDGNEEGNAMFSAGPNRADRLLAMAIKVYGKDSPQYLEVRAKVLAQQEGDKGGAIAIDPAKVADMVVNG